MKRTPFAAWPCSIARAVDIVGDWWTPLVLREMFYGLKRFDEFERTLGIGRNILTQRLNRLVAEGLAERVPYQDKPLRHEYLLTEMGRDFFPVLAAMSRWGNRWLAPEGAFVVFHHACGHSTQAEVVCAHCGDPLEMADIQVGLGPGYPARHRDAALATGRFVDRPDGIHSPG